MVKQIFRVKHYWKVVVYYNLDYHLFDIIAEDLRDIGFSDSSIDALYNMMSSGQAKAVTCNNSSLHISILLFNSHESKADYINSIVHEAEHIKQAMLKEYRIEDKGEPPAYTIGYLIGKMWDVAGKKLLNCK